LQRTDNGRIRLPQMGDEVIGYYGALHYSAAIDNPANKKFVKTYREKAKKVPSYFSERVILEPDGLWRRSSVNGDVENSAKFFAA